MKNERGSTLLMTVLTLAVVCILGGVVLSKSLYSLGESQASYDAKQAYYTAKSALDATISLFEKDPSIAAKLIGQQSSVSEMKGRNGEVKGRYELAITRDSKDHTSILIEATGYYGAQKAIAKATLKEHVGGGTPFDEGVIFCTNKPMNFHAPNGAFNDVIGDIWGVAAMNFTNIRVTGDIYVRGGGTIYGGSVHNLYAGSGVAYTADVKGEIVNGAAEGTPIYNQYFSWYSEKRPVFDGKVPWAPPEAAPYAETDQYVQYIYPGAQGNVHLIFLKTSYHYSQSNMPSIGAKDTVVFISNAPRNSSPEVRLTVTANQGEHFANMYTYMPGSIVDLESLTGITMEGALLADRIYFPKSKKENRFIYKKPTGWGSIVGMPGESQGGSVTYVLEKYHH